MQNYFRFIWVNNLQRYLIIVKSRLLAAYHKFLKSALGKTLQNTSDKVGLFLESILLEVRKIYLLFIIGRSKRWIFVFLVLLYLLVLLYKLFISPPSISCEFFLRPKFFTLFSLFFVSTHDYTTTVVTLEMQQAGDIASILDLSETQNVRIVDQREKAVLLFMPQKLIFLNDTVTTIPTQYVISPGSILTKIKITEGYDRIMFTFTVEPESSFRKF